jgi:hypothetical protein
VDLYALPIDDLRALGEDDGQGGQTLDVIRQVAAARALRSDGPLPDRLRLAKIALAVNQRMHGDTRSARVRAATQEFVLRAGIIDRYRPGTADPAWDPDVLAEQTLAALSFSPVQARALATGWRERPLEQIRELRWHKNLTGHLEMLIDHVRPGPVRDQLLVWMETRRHLP